MVDDRNRKLAAKRFNEHAKRLATFNALSAVPHRAGTGAPVGTASRRR